MLLLPFVFLIFALILNVGYGWVLRIKADAAVRFSGTYYVHLQSVDHANPAGATEQAVRKHYFDDDPEVRLTVGKEAKSLDEVKSQGDEHISGGGYDVGAVGKILGFLGDLTAKAGSRQKFQLTVPRHPPTGTLLPASDAHAYFQIDGNTWTHGEVPLTLSALTDVGTYVDDSALKTALGIISAPLRGFFWLLGMEP